MACSLRQEIPFSLFPRKFTLKLMDILMTNNALMDNWEHLAAYLGSDFIQHSILRREFEQNKNNPVEIMLEYYRRVPGSSIEKFLEVLNRMKRPDLDDIKQEIKVFLEKKHATNSHGRTCYPIENDETLCYTNVDKDLLGNHYSTQERKSYHKENLFPCKPISSPLQYMERISIPSEYPHSRINTSSINYIESNGVHEWSGMFANGNGYENDENFNDNSYLLYHSEQLIPKGPDLGNNQNVSSSLNSIISTTDQPNNLSTLDIPNFQNQNNHNGVNNLPQCPETRVISIDSKAPHKTIEMKVQNIGHIDITSWSSDPSQRTSSLPSLTSGDLRMTSISHKDTKSIIFVTYASDMKKRAKQLAKFFQRAKSNLEVIMVEDYSSEKANNFRRWVDSIMKRAYIIIVIISPQYKADVDSPRITDDSNLLVRYIADQLHNQYFTNGCKHIKARVIYFEQSHKNYIPEFLKSTIPFNYKNQEEWRQFYYMVIDHYSY